MTLNQMNRPKHYRQLITSVSIYMGGFVVLELGTFGFKAVTNGDILASSKFVEIRKYLLGCKQHNCDDIMICYAQISLRR